MIKFDKGWLTVELRGPEVKPFIDAVRGIPGQEVRGRTWYGPAIHAERALLAAMALWPTDYVDEDVIVHVTNLVRSRRLRSAHWLPQPEVRKRDAWLHQLQGYHFARLHTGTALGMSMGTGKSKVTVDLIQNDPQGGRVLIIAPKSVVTDNLWGREFEKDCAVPFEVLPLSNGTVEARQRALRQFWAGESQRIRAAVINYDVIWRMSWEEKTVPFDWIVADECHRMKSPGGKAARRGALLGRGKRRLALSGTLLPHSPLDAYGVYRFVEPGLFGTSHTRFRNRYAIMGGYQMHEVKDYQNLDELRRYMDLVTYTADASVLTLPPVLDVEVEVDLEPKALRIYASLERDFMAEVEGGTVTAASALVKLLRLQQVTGGWIRADDAAEPEQVSTAKGEALAELIEQAAGEPMVVFCRFRGDLATVHEVARRAGVTSAEVSGATNTLDAWKAGEAQIIAVQIQAGGLGIDLTRARYAVYYSLGYSLGDYLQSRARIHRPGQGRATTYYHLIARRTVDRQVYKALSKREEVVQSILMEVGR